MATKSPFLLIGSTPVWHRDDDAYIWVCGADIDGDGSGGNAENDPDFQPTTTLKNPDGSSINSRLVRGAVIPGKLDRAIDGIVMGALMRVRNCQAGLSFFFVAHDIGPDDKIGEVTIFGAEALQIPSSPIDGGTEEPILYMELWPGKAANIQGTQYQLQPS